MKIFKLIFRVPSAWIPLAMSLLASVLLLGYITLFGFQDSRGDEGLVARVFQLLLVGQVPFIGYFAFKSLNNVKNETLLILALQFLAAFIPFAVVLILENSI